MLEKFELRRETNKDEDCEFIKNRFFPFSSFLRTQTGNRSLSYFHHKSLISKYTLTIKDT